jgi:hypothetical protein
MITVNGVPLQTFVTKIRRNPKQDNASIAVLRKRANNRASYHRTKGVVQDE